MFQFAVWRVPFFLGLSLLCVCTELHGAGAQQFTVQPESVVQAEGLEAVFECQYPGAISYSWEMNEFPLDNLSPDPTKLTVQASVKYNNTVFQCIASVRLRGYYEHYRSRNASLIVHRIHLRLDMAANILTLSWSAFNFTSDVNYCVDYQIDRHILSECVNQTQYYFPYINYTICDRFSFTVTPTEGGRRGTSSQPEPSFGFFTPISGNEGITKVSIGVNETVKLVTFIGKIPNCTNFTSYQVDSDLLTSPIKGSVTDLWLNGSLTFSLPTDKVTEVTVTLTDINGIDLVFENIPTRTTDIQDLEINIKDSQIFVSVVFAGGSQSPGALVCVMPILTDGSLDFNNMTLTTIPQDRSESVDITVPTGAHRLFAFDLESNDLPRKISSAAVTRLLEVPSDFGQATINHGNNTFLSASNVDVAKLPNGTMTVSCLDIELDCVALLLNSIDPSILEVIGVMDSDERSVLFSPVSIDGLYIAVLTWERSQSILAVQLSFVSELKSIPTDPGVPQQTTPLWVVIVVVVFIVAGVGIIAIVVLLAFLVVRSKVKKFSDRGYRLPSTEDHQETHPKEESYDLRYQQLPKPAVSVEVEAESDIDSKLPRDTNQPESPVPCIPPESESEIQPPNALSDPELYEGEMEQLNNEAKEATDSSVIKPPESHQQQSEIESLNQENSTDEPANESNRTLIGKNNQSTGSLKSEPKKQGIFIKVSREDANQVTTSESIEENLINMSNNKEEMDKTVKPIQENVLMARNSQTQLETL